MVDQSLSTLVLYSLRSRYTMHIIPCSRLPLLACCLHHDLDQVSFKNALLYPLNFQRHGTESVSQIVELRSMWVKNYSSWWVGIKRGVEVANDCLQDISDRVVELRFMKVVLWDIPPSAHVTVVQVTFKEEFFNILVGGHLPNKVFFPKLSSWYICPSSSHFIANSKSLSFSHLPSFPWELWHIAVSNNPDVTKMCSLLFLLAFLMRTSQGWSDVSPRGREMVVAAICLAKLNKG